MKSHEHKQPSRTTVDHAVDHYPGAAVDHADNNEVDKEMVRERTRRQNNNPRNDESAMPQGEQNL